MQWQEAHAQLTRLARARAGLDLEEGRWLRAALGAHVHERLGYGGFVEYVERLFGYSPRLIHEKLRVAEALEKLPELSRALGDGAMSWSCARELTRVATPETEQAWLDAAQSKTTVVPAINAITVCEACQRAAQVGGGEAVEIPAPALEMARCDAQVLPRAVRQLWPWLWVHRACASGRD